MALIGVDVGTTGCKAVCFEECGNPVASAYRAYRQEHPHEIDPEELMGAVFAVLASVAAQCRGWGIAALAVSSFGESFVAVDGGGKALHRAILLTDPRGAAECDAFCTRVGRESVMETTGLNPHPMYSAAKLMWLQRHRPEEFRQAWHVFLMEDYVLWRLGAEPCVDDAVASRTMLFNIVGRRWDSALMDAAGIDPALFSAPVRPGTAVGRLDANAFGLTGLPQGLLLVAGSHDQICASIGAGCARPGHAVYGMGTSECVTPVFDHPILDRGFLEDHYACVPHAVEGCYATYAFNTSGGSLINWFRRTFARHLEQEAAAAGVSVFTLLEQGASSKPSTVLALPHVAGSGTPDLNHRATGAFLGMTVETGLPDLYRAVLEAVAFEMRYNLERLGRYCAAPSVLRAVGGGARSRLWLQIKSDVLGCEIATVGLEEAGTAGAAILAGVASGVYGDINEAAGLYAQVKDVVLPNPGIEDHYCRRYDRYKAMRALINESNNRWEDCL